MVANIRSTVSSPADEPDERPPKVTMYTPSSTHSRITCYYSLVESVEMIGTQLVVPGKSAKRHMLSSTYSENESFDRDNSPVSWDSVSMEMGHEEYIIEMDTRKHF